jgi:hypothetical protein
MPPDLDEVASAPAHLPGPILFSPFRHETVQATRARATGGASLTPERAATSCKILICQQKFLSLHFTETEQN